MNFKVKKVGTHRQNKNVNTVIEVEARTRRWGPPSARVLLLDNGDGELGVGDRIIEFHRQAGYCGGSRYVKAGRNSTNYHCAVRRVDALDIATYKDIANPWFKKARLQEWKAIRQFLGKTKRKPIKKAYCLASRPRSLRYLPAFYLKRLSAPLTLKRKVSSSLYSTLQIRKIRFNQVADPSRCRSVVARNVRMSFAGFKNNVTLSWNGPIHSAMRYLGMFGLKSKTKVDLIYRDRATGVIFVHTGLGSVSASSLATQTNPIKIKVGGTNPNQ